MKKIRIKEKHRELGSHYARFVDKRWHPGFTLSDPVLEVFVRVESCGRSACSDEELIAADPLFNGKAQRELTIKLLFDEMADWWSMGSGWFAPIAHTIETEMWSHGLARRDRVFIRALIKIMKSCHENGFMDTLMSFTGMPAEDKNRYLNRWLASNSASISHAL